MSNKDVIFPYYSGNIKFIKSLGHVSLEQFINAHKNPTNETKHFIDLIKKCKDPKAKRNLKHKLFSFTPSCLVNKGEKRSYSNIIKYTGLMQVDFDNIENKNKALDLKQWLYEQDECITSYLSPSGMVKGLLKIYPPQTKKQYKRIHNAVTEKYEQTTYFDVATKNAILPLFLSIDENILYKDIRDCYTWSAEKEEFKEHVALKELPNPTSISFRNNGSVSQKYYFDRTLKILTDKIENIFSDGHTQVRSASLILGSRVGAGYINESDARNYIEHLIINNKYLQKGTNGYIITANWAISEGIKNPKYY